MIDLLTPKEVAAKLHCSIKHLTALVRDGKLKCIDIGRGKKRSRRMFPLADYDEFIERLRQKEIPCQSLKKRARPTSNTTFDGEIIGITALLAERIAAKQKPSNSR